uniref:Uncharacterized protein n=1 Tax=Meloidogyne enterolobii TaxID=390850 RepID=A0A6V7TP17_MELEN|nr:unnamed protein product [Meloidogyne enterolobii]
MANFNIDIYILLNVFDNNNKKFLTTHLAICFNITFVHHNYIILITTCFGLFHSEGFGFALFGLVVRRWGV